MTVSTRGRRSANSIDAAIGANIRARRQALNLSQESLAQALGITFQQIQKYEAGTNRTASSTLAAIADVLETPVTALLPPQRRPARQAAAPDPMLEEMVAIFSRLSADGRQTMLALAEALEAHERPPP